MGAMTFNSADIPLVDIPVSGGVHFAVDAYNVNVSGTEDIVAAVAGKSHYIKRLIVHVAGIGGTETVTLGSGENSGAVKKPMVGPLGGSKEITTAGYAPSSRYEFDFANDRNMGRKLIKGEAFTIDSSVAVPVNVYVEGVTI